jgi:hypothetical protein
MHPSDVLARALALTALHGLPDSAEGRAAAAAVTVRLLARARAPDIQIDWCPTGCTSHRLLVRPYLGGCRLTWLTRRCSCVSRKRSLLYCRM